MLAEAVADCTPPDGVELRGVVSVPDEASLPADRGALAGWRVVTGTQGCSAQRNAGLDLLDDDVDFVFFFDDDAVVRSDYLLHALNFFRRHPEVVGLTGRVVLDGKLSEEIPRAAAERALRQSHAEPPSGRWSRTRELYGANFAYRRAAATDLRFDDRLPLYSWLEDHDFARRLLPVGVLAHVDDCVIVHRAAGSGGRTKHLRLGYSQVMNVVYLVRKGTFPLWLGAQQLGRPVAKNMALSLVGRSKSWRRERLRGNALAAVDVLRGRVTPERITDLQVQGSDRR